MMKRPTLLTFALLFCAACTDERPAAEQPAQTGTPAARQRAIEDLAMRIESYHEDDSLAATPGWQDGPVSLQRVEGGPARVFANRAAVRADLNRLLDSLRRTGPLNMSKAQHTDTMPHTGLMRPKRF